jgi:hypothetical protein
MVRVAWRVNPLSLLEGELRRHRQLLTGGDDVDHRRAIVAERVAERSIQFIRALNPHAMQPDRARGVRKFGLSRSVA